MLITFCISSLGGLAAHKLKIPAGLLLGAMFISTLFYKLFDFPPYPSWSIVGIQIAAGMAIGATITRAQFLGFKNLFIPALLLVIGMIALNFIVGYSVHLITGLDITTALLSSAPGGFTEMTLVAGNLGADVGLVAMLQLLRFIFAITCMPIILSKTYNNKTLTDASKEANLMSEKQKNNTDSDAKKIPNSKITIVISVLAGIIGHLSPIPAGGLTLAFIGSAIYNLLTKKGHVPPKQREVTQLLAGIYLGSTLTISDVILQPKILFIVFIFILIILICSILIGLVVYKSSDLSFPTAILSSIPGGVSAMSLIASDFGADPAQVSLMQLTRMITVIVLFPSMIQWIISVTS